MNLIDRVKNAVSPTTPDCVATKTDDGFFVIVGPAADRVVAARGAHFPVRFTAGALKELQSLAGDQPLENVLGITLHCVLPAVADVNLPVATAVVRFVVDQRVSPMTMVTFGGREVSTSLMLHVARHEWGGRIMQLTIASLDDKNDRKWSAVVQPSAQEIAAKQQREEREKAALEAHMEAERLASIRAKALSEIHSDIAAAILETQIAVGLRTAEGSRK